MFTKFDYFVGVCVGLFLVFMAYAIPEALYKESQASERRMAAFELEIERSIWE